MATVLHRTTLELLVSVNTPDYDLVDWIINPDLSQVQGVPKRYWKIVGDTVTASSQAEQDSADTVALPEIKNKIMRELDEEVEQRIRQGFEWPVGSGQYFSLSMNAQIKWTNLFISKDILIYPLKVPSKDDDTVHDIIDTAEAQNMYQTAVFTIDTLLKEVTLVKIAVISAATILDAETVRDTYLVG